MASTFEWPPKVADISPIDACFGEMQRRTKEKYSEISIQDELVFEEQFTNFIKKCYYGAQS
jgi:hypothetical protein